MEQANIILSTTLAQKQLFALAQINEEGQLAYNEAYALELNGPLDRVAMRKALQGVVDRRDCLRITITPAGEQQVIHASSKVNARYISTEGFSEGANSEAVKKWIDDELSIKFDLVNGPLYRFCLAKINENQHILLMVYHHIIIDGWSVSICLKDVAELYSAEVEHRKASLEPAGSFAEYVSWLSDNLDKEELQSCKKYWLSLYENEFEPLTFPKKIGGRTKTSFWGGVIRSRIESEIAINLNHFAEKNNSSVMMVLYAAYAAFISRICRQNDFIVGVPSLGRNFKSSEYIAGYCTSILPILNEVKSNNCFISCLESIEKNILDAYEYQSYPYAHILDDVSHKYKVDRGKFIQTTLNYMSYFDSYSFANMLSVNLPIEKKYIAFDLEINIVKTHESYDFYFKYSNDLFDKESVEILRDSFFVFLKEVLSNQNKTIGECDLLTEKDKEKLTNKWIDTKAPYPKEKCIHTLFEDQVNKDPKSTALIFNGESVSYEELNRSSNQLAHYLVKQGIEPGSLVGVCINRSIQQVISMLGIIKAGGAYVPIDPSYPKSRIIHMIEDSYLQNLITISSCLEGLPELSCQVINLDHEVIKKKLLTQDICNPDKEVCRINSNGLAYVIYTSGSTGRPKGVAIKHESLVNLGDNIYRILIDSIIEKTVWAWNASYSFDASLQAFSQLAYGATLVLMPEEIRRDPILTLDLFKKYSVNVFDCTPIQLKMLLDNTVDTKFPVLFVGGEKLGKNLWGKVSGLSATSNITAYNVYGPTEACVNSTVCRISKNNPSEHLGTFLNNIVGYVVNENNLVPIGVPGELLLGGDGIAQCYLNRPDLTEEKFIANPFNVEMSSKLYRTGDLCRWLPNGNLEYIGRIDNQIKIRGYRIELGEIESCLSECLGITDCAIATSESQTDNKEIVAYIVPKIKYKSEIEAELFFSEIKKYLRENLPTYMIPAYFVLIEKVPLTPNGKLDKKSLPDPRKRILPKEKYFKPSTDEEKKISKLWQEILNIKQVGLHDNFFDLGGDSIKIVTLRREINNRLNIGVEVVDLFSYPTISEFISYLHGKEDTSSDRQEILSKGRKSLKDIRNKRMTVKS